MTTDLNNAWKGSHIGNLLHTRQEATETFTITRLFELIKHELFQTVIDVEISINLRHQQIRKKKAEIFKTISNILQIFTASIILQILNSKTTEQHLHFILFFFLLQFIMDTTFLLGKDSFILQTPNKGTKPNDCSNFIKKYF